MRALQSKIEEFGPLGGRFAGKREEKIPNAIPSFSVIPISRKKINCRRMRMNYAFGRETALIASNDAVTIGNNGFKLRSPRPAEGLRIRRNSTPPSDLYAQCRPQIACHDESPLRLAR